MYNNIRLPREEGFLVGLVCFFMQAPNTARLPNVGPVQFIREVITELKKVSWPTREETIKLTGLVIVISVIVGLFIGGLDIALIQISAVVFNR